jgi:hypothetical protein
MLWEDMLLVVTVTFLVVAQFQAVNYVNETDFTILADAGLQDQYSKTAFYRAFCVAALCVSETPSNRPAISEVVDALTRIPEMKVRRRPRRQLATPRTQTGTGSDRN